ncbi:MAG: sugar phosphate isomerase/epimerase [Armatimonadetes bacterium]|nr:sugar phosphate isomerase/epimerase [Armatimonadota bacterium]
MAPFKICCHLIQYAGREKEEPEWVLDNVAAAGYDGCEGFGPQTPEELVAVAMLAAQRGLHLVNIGGPTPEAKLQHNVTLGNDACEVPAARKNEFGGPDPTDADFAAAAATLTDIIARCEQHHVKPFHHAHIGTMIETQEDAERMLAAAPGLQLLLDTGHLTCAGSDALATLWACRDRIGHVHLKDFWAVDPATWRWPGSKYGEEGWFRELGDGNMGLDVPGVLKALEEIGYDGWVSVELDRATVPMEEAARKNRDYLGGLGY